MSKASLTVWCNPQVSDAARELLVEGTKPHRLVFSPVATYNLDAGPPDPALLEADVAFGQPDPQTVMQANRLRWVHLTSAGYARYDTPEFRNALGAGAHADEQLTSVCRAVCRASVRVHARSCATAVVDVRDATDGALVENGAAAGRIATARRAVDVVAGLWRDRATTRRARAAAANEHRRCSPTSVRR